MPRPDVELILSRLRKCKRTGDGSWIACCPAHEDRTPSFTVRQLEDGRILMHCFGGCEISSVLDALGLKFADVMPERLAREFKPGIPRAFTPTEALTALKHESMIVAIMAARMLDGNPMTEEDTKSLCRATGLINSALEVSHGLIPYGGS